MKPEFLPLHGGQLDAIAKEFGVPVSSLIDFSANINPDGPPASVLAALERATKNHGCLTQYPDLEETRLKAALAIYAETLPNRLLVSNGFVPLLDATIRALGIRTCMMPIPSFVEYRRTLERNGITPTTVALSQSEDFQYDLDRLLEGRHDAILLANPQNPTGVLCDKKILAELIARAALRGTYILLDEAFIDYAAGQSLTSLIESFDNLIVFRSLTKCFGVPGLRVAYSIAHETVRPKIEAFLSPWSITNLASEAMIAAVEDTDFLAKFPSVNELRRSNLAQNLLPLGIVSYPAVANYLLLCFPPGSDTKTIWRDLIREHGVVLRSCENFEGLPGGHLRAAVLDAAKNQILIHALAKVL